MARIDVLTDSIIPMAEAGSACVGHGRQTARELSGNLVAAFAKCSRFWIGTSGASVDSELKRNRPNAFFVLCFESVPA
jgi:hypothetical protein